MNAILSIRPQFVEEIVIGKKKFEYRKSVFKRSVDRVYVYASSPVSRIVGEFEPVDVLTGSPDDIWGKTKKFSGITKKYFDEYFMERKTAYAIEIKNFMKYERPLDLPKGVKAPQSYCYCDSM